MFGLVFFSLPGCMEALQLFSLPSIYALGLCYLVTRDKQGVEKILFKKIRSISSCRLPRSALAVPRAAGILPICCRRLPRSEPPAQEAQAPTEGISYTQGGSRGGQVGILLEQQTVPSGLGESGGLSASHPPASLGRGRGDLEWRNQTGISRLLQPKRVVGSFPCLAAPQARCSGCTSPAMCRTPAVP